MNGLALINVNDENGIQTVSARELHEKLKIATAFKDWFPRVCEYGFIEGPDFCSFLSESTGGRPSKDYFISIEMAKQICMLQRTEIGKRYREYFLQLERAWNSPEAVMSRALQIANRTLENAKKQIVDLTEKNNKLQTTNNLLMHTSKTYTATEIAKELGLSSAQKLNQILSEKGIQYLRNGTWVPTSKYADKEYYEIKQDVLENGKVIYNSHITQKGRNFILNIIKAENRQKLA